MTAAVIVLGVCIYLVLASALGRRLKRRNTNDTTRRGTDR